MIRTSAFAFLSVIAFAVSSADAQIFSSRGFCGANTVATRQNEVNRARTRCDQAGPYIQTLQNRMLLKNAQDDSKLAAMETSYGIAVTACAQTYPSGDAAGTCGILSDRELTRAERLVREYIKVETYKINRAADFQADVAQYNQQCVTADETTSEFNWRSLICASRPRLPLE